MLARGDQPGQGPGASTSDLPLADELATVFARLGGLLIGRETVDTSLRLIVELAQETIPGTVGCGVTLLHRGRPSSTAASSALVEKADALQYSLDEGPCLHACRSRTTVLVDDLGAESRWPRWREAVAPLGLRSSLSAPLVAADVAVGAMKLYGAEPGRFLPRDEHLLRLLAAQAGVLVANVQSYEQATRMSDQLKDALRSRDVIGTAKGIVMAREGVDEDAAFAMLVAVSQRANRPLREVAEELVRTTARRQA